MSVVTKTIAVRSMPPPALHQPHRTAPHSPSVAFHSQHHINFAHKFILDWVFCGVSVSCYLQKIYFKGSLSKTKLNLKIETFCSNFKQHSNLFVLQTSRSLAASI